MRQAVRRPGSARGLFLSIFSLYCGSGYRVLLRQVRGGGGGRRHHHPPKKEEGTAVTDPERVHAERMGGMVSGIVGEIMLHHGIGTGCRPREARELADMDPALLASMWYDANDDFMATIDALIRTWGHASRELQVRTSEARGEEWGVQRARDIEAYMASRGGDGRRRLA